MEAGQDGEDVTRDGRTRGWKSCGQEECERGCTRCP